MLGLMDLPLEVRLMIYGLLLKQDQWILHTYRDFGLAPQILRSSKTIHAEACPLLYGENVYGFKWSRYTCDDTLRWLSYNPLNMPLHRLQHAIIHIGGGGWIVPECLSKLVEAANIHHIHLQTFTLGLDVTGCLSIVPTMIAILLHRIKASRKQLMITTDTDNSMEDPTKAADLLKPWAWDHRLLLHRKEVSFWKQSLAGRNKKAALYSLELREGYEIGLEEDFRQALEDIAWHCRRE
ncbi:uncharacterized protein KY384_007509 [Bacidia gigantensis]|uniref:uncharacterized protein n=1 Tax=Bacidia gigantensis TaxID=2732470 RepID=UPI001D04D2A0|nr:uncharacterized protein KY384_007509 [Bacidia gigantensis]KAG8527357.1 hypothetical protein KY384_007509 [Bacidia gigantensis]